MKIVKVKVYYDNNSINVVFDDNNLVLLSENKKELNAEEIYDMFKYENDKKYELAELEDLKDLDEDSKYYTNECYKIFKNIIDGISTSKIEKND